MLGQDYTTKLLDLEDVVITAVQNTFLELRSYIELLHKKHACPCCGAATDKVHEYRTQVVKDMPFGRDTLLHLRKRRYRCLHCGKGYYSED